MSGNLFSFIFILPVIICLLDFRLLSSLKLDFDGFPVFISVFFFLLSWLEKVKLKNYDFLVNLSLAAY